MYEAIHCIVSSLPPFRDSEEGVAEDGGGDPRTLQPGVHRQDPSAVQTERSYCSLLPHTSSLPSKVWQITTISYMIVENNKKNTSQESAFYNLMNLRTKLNIGLFQG